MDRVKQKGEKKRRTHHGVYMFQREVTAGSLFGEDTEEEKITTCGYRPPLKKKSHHIVLCHIVSPRPPPQLQVTLGVILCPNVA